METVPVNHNARRAAACITLVFVLGTYCGLNTGTVPGFILMISFLSWILALLSLIYSSFKPQRVSAAWIATICIQFCIYCTAYLSASLSLVCGQGFNFRQLDGECIDVKGVVSSDADVLPSFKTNRTVVQYYLMIEEAGHGGISLPAANQRIRVMCYGWNKADIPLYGERWKLSGRVSVDKRKSQKGSGVITLKSGAYDSKLLSGGSGWWLAERCYAARRAASALLSEGISDYPATSDILQSLILGYRRLSYEMRQLFVFTGTLHIFAISGSHVVVFGGIIVVVLGMFRISSIYWGFFLGPLLCVYTFATGMQSSAVRACIMALIYWCAPVFGRRADSLTALCVAALLIVAAVPTQLFDTGFLLSFVCVLGLIVLFPLINTPVQKKLEPDPLRLQPESSLVTTVRMAGKGLWSMTAMSIAAWLVSAPLTSYYFGNFTPIGLLANLIVIPVSTLVILSGCLSLVLGSCVQWFAVIFNHANVALIWLMVSPMELLAKVPYGNIKTDNMPVWVLILWYVMLVSWVLWRRYHSAASDCGLVTGKGRL